MPNRPLPPHLQIYTWQSCTLRELSHLLLLALPSLLPSSIASSSPSTQSPASAGTRLSYRLIFPDTRATGPGAGRFLTKNLGDVILCGVGDDGVEATADERKIIGENSPVGGLLAGEPGKTLGGKMAEGGGGFVVGDYLCVAVLPPGARGLDERIARTENGGEGFRIRGRDGPTMGRDRDWGREDKYSSGEWRRGDVVSGRPGRS